MGINKKVAIVDYGMGNLRSVYQALFHAAHDLPFDILVTSNPDEVNAAHRVVLPGQGAMKDCIAALKSGGLFDAVMNAASISPRPLFGVCVGMQMLLEHSQEGDTPCLGLFSGDVVKFTPQNNSNNILYKVPQIGWNKVKSSQNHFIFNNIENINNDGQWFYFVHSYYAKPSNENDIAGKTIYCNEFASAIAKDNIFATQFHPEKSAKQGLALYRNFLNWNI